MRRVLGGTRVGPVRKRDAPPAPAPVGRPFNELELAAIRRTIYGWDDRRAHPHPGAAELEAIHAAAGRQRGFKLWTLDYVSTADEFERAFEEEITDSLTEWLALPTRRRRA